MPHSTLRRTTRRKNLTKKWAKKKTTTTTLIHLLRLMPRHGPRKQSSRALPSSVPGRTPRAQRGGHITSAASIPSLILISTRADHAKKLAMSTSSISRSSSRPSTAGAGGALAATSADTTSWSSFWPRHPASSNGR